jgi:hypothetical protein
VRVKEFRFKSVWLQQYRVVYRLLPSLKRNKGFRVDGKWKWVGYEAFGDRFLDRHPRRWRRVTWHKWCHDYKDRKEFRRLMRSN